MATSKIAQERILSLSKSITTDGAGIALTELSYSTYKIISMDAIGYIINYYASTNGTWKARVVDAGGNAVPNASFSINIHYVWR